MSETPKALDPAPADSWLDHLLAVYGRHRPVATHAAAELAALRSRLSAAEAARDTEWRGMVKALERAAKAEASLDQCHAALDALDERVNALRAVAVAVVAHRAACEQRWKDYDRMMVEAGATRVPDDDADPWPDWVAVTDALEAARAAGHLGEAGQ